MHTIFINNYEVSWDGRRVWINGPDGVSRARYKLGVMDVCFSTGLDGQSQKKASSFGAFD